MLSDFSPSHLAIGRGGNGVEQRIQGGVVFGFTWGGADIALRGGGGGGLK